MLGERETKEQLKKKDQIQLSTIKADLYLKKGLERQALKELSMIDALQKKSSKKNRLNYIMGQLYKNNKDYFLSEEQFKKVVRSNADYEMIFNAKMNLATLTNLQNKDVQKMQKSLLKMTKDEKNIDYLDQIYYNLAEIFVSAGDTAEGIKTYILSTKQVGKNQAQKALSFLSLAELYYAENDYYTSKDYYDSTIYYMQDDYRGYSQVKQKQSLLSELVENLLRITLEDSLQALAQLSEEDLKNTIQEVINQKKAKERELLEKERRREQSFTTSNRYTERNEQFGRNTSGGNWYFYNPATLSFGQSEFRKKWGKRKLEDDWRRKDKNIIASFLDTDSFFIDTLNSNTDSKQGGMAYYLEKIPKNEKDILSSSSKKKKALKKKE